MCYLQGNIIPQGPEPTDLLNQTISLIPSVPADNAPFGKNFGDVFQQPPEVVKAGEIVTVVFVSAQFSCLQNILTTCFYLIMS